MAKPAAKVVLLRGANLGKRRFSPAALAAALADLDVVNLGAAGTFVVRAKVTEAALRDRIAAELPWPDPEMVVLGQAEVSGAVAAGRAVPVPAGARKMGLALHEPLPDSVRLPFVVDAQGTWGLRYDVAVGRIVVGVRKRVDEVGLYPTDALEKAVGARGTSRDWPTWGKLATLLPP